MLELPEGSCLSVQFCLLSDALINTIEYLQAGNAKYDKQTHNGKKSTQQLGMNICRDPGNKI
jgi:hypothetical protein